MTEGEVAGEEHCGGERERERERARGDVRRSGGGRRVRGGDCGEGIGGA